MIHASISEDRASLVQGMSRAVLIFDMTLDADLEVQQAVVRSDQINVAYRISYQDIPLVLADSEHAAHPSLAAATQLTSRLLAQRRNKGALALYDMAPDRQSTSLNSSHKCATRIPTSDCTHKYQNNYYIQTIYTLYS